MSHALNKLRALSLGGMAPAFIEQLERPHYAKPSFEERLGPIAALVVVHTDLVDSTAMGGRPPMAVWWRRSL